MAKINLKTGRAMVQTEVKPADVTGALMPEEAKPGRQVPSALAEKLATVWRQYHKDQNGRITTLNDRLVGIEVVLEKLGQEYQKRVVLNAWELKTGAAVEPVELVKDKALNIANIVLTEDRRHVAVVFNNSTLTIYSLANPGKFLAKDVKGIVSAEQAFIHDKRIYFSQLTGRGAKETPTTLKALDLDSGKVAWERDLKARSTFPLAP